MYSKEQLEIAIQKILLELTNRELSRETVASYRYHYNALLEYTNNTNCIMISESTFLDFLKDRFALNIPSLYVKGQGKRDNRRIRPFALLTHYLQTGEINSSTRIGKGVFTPPNGFESSYNRFILFLQEKKLKSPTIHTNTRIVERFIQFLYDEERIIGIDLLQEQHITAFWARLEKNSAKSNGTVLYVLRNYLVYIYSLGITDYDMSCILPKIKIPRHGEIPHAWTKEELQAILLAIDREDPTGKRNYAILLLVIQTGFRAADIRRLKLQDIDWNGHRIRTITGKIDQEVELPLLEQTGWAIIDYLKNGRPKTDSNCVFVRHIPPYCAIGSTATLDSALNRYILKAGISITKGEHHGMHTLRNSLALHMLETGATIPVISQTLGHSDINTTAIYLKIDLEGLRKCALPLDTEEMV